MAVLPIRQFPDDAGLRRKAKRVRIIDESIQKLINDMTDTMQEAKGVGLAGPQVGVPLRVIVIQMPDEEPFAIINPEVVKRVGEQEVTEGCLSIPGLRGLVPRHRRIGVRYLTRKGEVREEEYADFLARVFQHEFDHVQGMVFIDRVESTRELVTEKEYLRSQQIHA